MDTYKSLILLGSVSGIVPVFAEKATSTETERPNIVWFLTEDLSTHYLAMYNNGKGAATPNVERLAKHGIVFSNAYSNAPVSSAARTTLITGCYAPSLEGSFHRCLKPMPMPENLNMFPAYLRENGYFTCNASKTDYNVKIDEKAWDRKKGKLDVWRERKDKSQPFFFMRSNLVTHESRLQFNEETYTNKKTNNDPDKVFIHPTLPDTKLVRYTYATFYDRINDSDKELGELIDMFEEEGVMDNTFIFYFGDNGGSLPGTKGYTNDIGIHVPLVVYVPEKWKDKIGIETGTTDNTLVSFMDFGPTVLNLAGVDIPARMDGKPFLGKDADKRDDVVFGYGDRFDEFYAFNRCIRQGKYRYARNYLPYHTRSLFAFYRYKQLAFREWKDLYMNGKLNDSQGNFFKQMPVEELYDLENDPFELHNLAKDPKYKEVVAGLRGKLNNYMIEKADLGFFPESIIFEEGYNDPSTYGQTNKKRISKFIEIADMQTAAYNKKIEKKLIGSLSSDDPVERWWALTSCAYFADKCSNIKDRITSLLKDERSFVRSRAMVALSIMGERFTKENFLYSLSDVRTVAETLLLLNDLTYLYENNLIKPFELSMDYMKYKNFGEEWRLKYLNSFVYTDKPEERWDIIYDKKSDKQK